MTKAKKSKDIIDGFIDLLMRLLRISLDTKVYQTSYGHPYRIHSVGYQVWLGKLLIANYYAVVNEDNGICLVLWKGMLKKHYINIAQDRMIEYCEKHNPSDREHIWFYWNERDSAISVY